MAKGPTGNIGKKWRKQATRGFGVNRRVAKQQEIVNSYLRTANGMSAVSELMANLMDRAGLILEVPTAEESVKETA